MALGNGGKRVCYMDLIERTFWNFWGADRKEYTHHPSLTKCFFFQGGRRCRYVRLKNRYLQIWDWRDRRSRRSTPLQESKPSYGWLAGGLPPTDRFPIRLLWDGWYSSSSRSYWRYCPYHELQTRLEKAARGISFDGACGGFFLIRPWGSFGRWISEEARRTYIIQSVVVGEKPEQRKAAMFESTTSGLLEMLMLRAIWDGWVKMAMMMRMTHT